MLRQASFRVMRRTGLEPFHDSFRIVDGIDPDNGTNRRVMRELLCEMPSHGIIQRSDQLVGRIGCADKMSVFEHLGFCPCVTLQIVEFLKVFGG